MANEGSDANSGNYSYDVFFSFYGIDTRQFVASLIDNLREKGLIIFWHEDLMPGYEISPSLYKAIEESRILIVVLSENFANSLYCLNELDKIVESKCKKMKSQLVIPIFYDVEPSDVRYCKNKYAQAMEKHEIKFGREKVEKWRLALHHVSDLNGWRFKSYGRLTQHKLAQELFYWITKNVVDRNNHSFFNYDVFLSFSWEDTRYSFTGFLRNALKKEGFRIFMDDDMSGKDSDKVQERIPITHINAIQESKFSIIVFSENYAYSPCCLDALVKILECKKSKKQRVLPIFYKVQPSDVRYQTSSFREAMNAHERENDLGQVQKWRSALFEVASLKGWHFETGYEYKTIERIVGFVNKSLPRYDVFLSFRGQDTRYSFTGYLYYALCKKGFKTFMDDEVLEGGEQISDILTNAIKESRFSIVVFSKNYAFSSWCLDELVHILECRRMKTHLVYPIYYKVEPSHVWNQTYSYGEAMNAHETRLKYEDGRVQQWRSALSEVASLDGLHFKDKDGDDECEFIEKIVEKISNNPLYVPSTSTSVI